FRLVGFAIAEKTPNLAVGLRHQAAVFQVLPEPRLVDGHDRAQTHRHRRRLPELRHQPWMRIGTQPAAVNLHAQAVEFGLADTAFEEGARVDAGTGMALDVQQVARMRLAGSAPEMVEADVVQRRRRGETGDM